MTVSMYENIQERIYEGRREMAPTECWPSGFVPPERLRFEAAVRWFPPLAQLVDELYESKRERSRRRATPLGTQVIHTSGYAVATSRGKRGFMRTRRSYSLSPLPADCDDLPP